MKATLVSRIMLSPRVVQLTFETSNPQGFEFVPGQFVTLHVPSDSGFEERSYSIASHPDSRGQFELCISLNPEGKVTPILWDLKNGAALDYSGPHGSFTLRDAPGLEQVFVCTGTGVAPFRSMIANLREMGFPVPVYLIFGNRTEEDILYRDEFELLDGQFNNFHFIPVLSRGDWSGEKGYVHAVYEKLFADGRDARFYVCGWKEMCTEARNRLKDLGYNRRQYFFEDYG